MVNYDAQDGFSVSSTTANSPFALDTGSNALGTANTDGLLIVGGSLPTAGYEGHEQQHQQIRDRAGGTLQQPQGQQMTVHQSYLLTPSTSLLTIQEVHFHHAGNYTCAPSNARPASITVHVLRGEKPAAMQHANRSNIFDNNDSSGNNNNNNNNNNNYNKSHSIGAIGASTSGAMAQFAQNSLILMAFASLHLALWQLSKLLSLSSMQQKLLEQQQKQQNTLEPQQQGKIKAVVRRRTSSSLPLAAAAATKNAVAPSLILCCCTYNCCHSSRHATLSLSLPQSFQQSPPQNVQQKLQLLLQIQHETNLAVALMYFYHKIQR